MLSDFPGEPALTRRERRDRTASALVASGSARSETRREELLDYVVRINMGVARSVASRYSTAASRRTTWSRWRTPR